MYGRFSKNIGQSYIDCWSIGFVNKTAKTLDAAKNGWNNNWNKYINELEQNCQIFGGKICHQYLQLHWCFTHCFTLGVSKGDEVIVPDINGLHFLSGYLFR